MYVCVCVCVCCIELIAVLQYTLWKWKREIVTFYFPTETVWIKWNMSLCVFISNLDWSSFILFIMCTHIACYVMRLIQPTNLFRRTRCFQCRHCKGAGFQLGTLTRVIAGWGPITVSSVGTSLLVTEGNGHVDPAILRFFLLF